MISSLVPSLQEIRNNYHAHNDQYLLILHPTRYEGRCSIATNCLKAAYLFGIRLVIFFEIDMFDPSEIVQKANVCHVELAEPPSMV